jgi:hypothetical protein
MILLGFLISKDLVAFKVVGLLFLPNCFLLLLQLLLGWLADCTTPLFPLDPPLNYIALLNNVSLYRSAISTLLVAYIAFVKVEINRWNKGLCFKALN